MNTEMVGALNNAFREVAIKFALVVADRAYSDGFDDGRYEESYMNSMNYLGD
jgi:hypothetical protein